ncbi:MAG: adenylate/guanylate cyclase domain-containing protein [Elusimicrobiota bacterium]
MKILVVDDEKQNRNLLYRILLPHGYDILLSDNGEDALNKIKAVPPDLILLDVMMPGKNGYEVCRILKSDKSTVFIPVVILTALNDRHAKIKGIEAGADDFLSKPIDIQELLTRVKSLLRIKTMHDEIESKNVLLNKILNQYVVTEVSNQMMENPDKYLKLGGEYCCATILFADICGFTNFSEQRNPMEIVELLNSIFSELTKIIFKYNGTFDKYIGDAIMAYYSVPGDTVSNAIRALNTAKEMQAVFLEMKRNKPEVMNSLGLAIGINTGEVVVGNIGSEKMMDYTVIGDPVNTAKKLQAEAVAGQILLTENTYNLVKNEVKVKGLPPVSMKGKTNPIKVYELLE